jgi:hypothetical protein
MMAATAENEIYLRPFAAINLTACDVEGGMSSILNGDKELPRPQAEHVGQAIWTYTQRRVILPGNAMLCCKSDTLLPEARDV